MKSKVLPKGPKGAKILIVGEAPGETEVREGAPFVGASGKLLDQMLAQAGIDPQECRVTNVTPYRPPGNDIAHFFRPKAASIKAGHAPLKGVFPGEEIREGLHLLEEEITTGRPAIILAVGATALWALTDVAPIKTTKGTPLPTGIGKWRGSHLRTFGLGREIPVVPILHPAYILRMYAWRSITVQDIRRAKDILEGRRPADPPDWHFHLTPTISEFIEYANSIIASKRPAAVDIETYGGLISCVGIAADDREAMCVPLALAHGESYFTEEEELTFYLKLRELFDSVEIRGQNFLYDAQYFSRWAGTYRLADFDTMIAQGVLFPGLPKGSKGLDFLSSMYCSYHRYWKDDTKSYDPSIDPETLWAYNCRDVIATWEVAERQKEAIASMGYNRQFSEVMETALCCYDAMLRGVKVDEKRIGATLLDLMEISRKYDQWFDAVVDDSVIPRTKTRKDWWRSPRQQAEFFYELMQCRPHRNHKRGSLTCDDDALKKIAKENILLKPICDSLRTYRSIGVLSSVLLSRRDPDGRMRCSYNPVGTITFRLSSSESVWGTGTNLQNITAGSEPEPDSFAEYKTEMPNIRRIFVPDEGYIICDVDLDRADLAVVIWEAQDEELMQMFLEGVNIHEENAKVLFPGKDCRKSSDPTSPYHRAKQGVHATNYGATPPTLARHLGITVKEAESFQRRWFAAHPGIREWHRRVEYALMTEKKVRNILGYEITFFDRMEGVFTNALAWIPQSTVGLVINEGWRRIRRQLPEVVPLLQVHDSLVLEVPKADFERLRGPILECLRVELPYDPPLIIPSKMAISEVSWGDVS